MDRDALEEEMDDLRDLLATHDEVMVFEPHNQPYDGFVFEGTSLRDFTEKALDRDINEFYLLEERNEDDQLDLAGVCYFHEGRAHSCYLMSNERQQATVEEADTTAHGFGREESEEERQRKQEIAQELLDEYEDYLSEDEKFELDNRLDRMRLRRLLQIKDRVEQEASADPEEEKRLAKAVYQDERFNRQFNETDTEMLIDDLDVEYDPNSIRVEEVHKRAKSLLKINK